MKYAIIAEFDIIPGCDPELEKILRDTARWALEEEPRCLRFEVMKPTDENGNPIPNRLMTNEVFEGFEGVQEHRAQPVRTSETWLRGSCPILQPPPQRFRPLPERVSASSTPAFHPHDFTKTQDYEARGAHPLRGGARCPR